LSVEQTDNRWRPSADLAVMHCRAELLNKIRCFFNDRQVLEVDTPVLSHAGNPDAYIESFVSQYDGPGGSKKLYLQSSPEFAMKRLLSSGSGPIYQICKAFRNEELSRLHNPEFTMLEWYRPGFGHHELMSEVEDLLKYLGLLSGDQRVLKMTYQALFERYADVSSHSADLSDLWVCIQEHNINLSNQNANDNGGRPDFDKDTLLNVILTHVIEPELSQIPFVFVYDFPPSQASLAKIRSSTPPVAERFELYGKGMELANGFNELTDNVEQHDRFVQDQMRRKQKQQQEIQIDQYLIDALSEGMPDCAGVAMGLDRLLMLLSGKQTLKEVMAFPFDRA